MSEKENSDNKKAEKAEKTERYADMGLPTSVKANNYVGAVAKTGIGLGITGVLGSMAYANVKHPDKAAGTPLIDFGQRA